MAPPEVDESSSSVHVPDSWEDEVLVPGALGPAADMRVDLMAGVPVMPIPERRPPCAPATVPDPLDEGPLAPPVLLAGDIDRADNATAYGSSLDLASSMDYELYADKEMKWVNNQFITVSKYCDEVANFGEMLDGAETRLLHQQQDYFAKRETLAPIKPDAMVRAMQGSLEFIDNHYRKMMKLAEKWKISEPEAQYVKKRYENYVRFNNDCRFRVFQGSDLYKYYLDEEHVFDCPEHPRYHTVTKLFKDALIVHRPFYDKPDFEANASHVVMNTSRLLGTQHVLMKAIKKASEYLKKNPLNSVAVVDIGTGSFGMQNLALAKAMPTVPKELHFHALAPVTHTEDARRMGKLRDVDGIRYINTQSGYMPKAGYTVNYCHHKCRNCTCLKRYDKIFPVAIHSNYYLNVLDYEVLAHNANELLSVEHVPEVGRGVPVQNPEFEWGYADESPLVGRATKWGIKLRQWLSGERYVALNALRRSETTYYHENTSKRLAAGGFHLGPVTNKAQEMIDDPVEAIKVISLGAFATFASTFVATPGDLVVRTVVGTVAAGITASMSVAVVRAAKKAQTFERPFPGTTHTVEMTENMYKLHECKSPVFSIVTAQFHKPKKLSMNRLKQDEVDTEAANRVAAALFMAGDTEKTRNQVRGNMFRLNMPVEVIKGTVNQGVRLFHYVAESVTDPPQPQTMPAFLKAAIFLPCAWIAARLMFSCIPVPSSLREAGFSAIAPILPVATPFFMVIYPLLSVKLCLLVALWAATWAAVLSMQD